MDVFQGVLQTTIRMSDRFFSRARLYRLHPVYEVLREWKSVETVLIDVSGLPCGGQGELQTTQVFCVGGRLGTLHNGYSFPDQTIECRTELIRKLAECERQLIGLDSANAFGTEIHAKCPPPGMFIITDDGNSSFSLERGAPFHLEISPMVARSIKPVPTVFEPQR
jgi:hypothetical protein